MRTITTGLAILLVAATTGAASAHCVSAPDDASTAYVRNGLKQTICLNNELATTTATKNWQVEVNTAITQIQQNMIDNRLEAIKPAVPSPFSPTWP